MPALVARDFSGMHVGRSVRLLPPNVAADAANVDLSSGSLVPMLRPVKVHEAPGSGAKKFARLRFNDGTVFWLPLSHRLSDVIKSPVVNDSHERVYILDPPGTPLRFNTKARLLAGQPSFLLGLPAPVSAPTVTVSGGSGLSETRAYVYTFVDDYGHEGPPSEPTLQSGFANGTWTVGGMDTSVPDAAQRPGVKKRIYRSLSTNDGIGGYFFVAEVALSVASYDDTAPGTLIALNNTLESVSFYAPPDDLDGMVLMPGGFFIGWRGRDLHFSVPYRPWAWPPEFDLTLEHAVVGVGVTKQTAVCATTGSPYLLTGTSPAQVTPARLDVIEPCLDKLSVIGSDDGVYYASREGVVFVTSSTARVLTSDAIPGSAWYENLKSGVVGAAKTKAQYFILSADGEGWRIDVWRDKLSVSRLQNFTRYTALWNDTVTGSVLLVDTFDQDGPIVYELATSGQDYVPFLWSSGEITTPRPTNFTCGRIELDTGALVGRFAPRPPVPEVEGIVDSFAPTGEWPPPEEQHQWRLYGASVVNHCLPGSFLLAGTIPAGTLAPGTESFGDLYMWPFWPGMTMPTSLLYLASVTLPKNIPCWFWYWAGRRLAFSEPIMNDSMFRLPSGFKSDIHAFAVVSVYPIHSIQLSTSPADLEAV